MLKHIAIFKLTSKTFLFLIAILSSASIFAEADINRRINRLFLTPTFRAQIDLFRNNPDLYKKPETATTDKQEEIVQEPTTPSTIKVKGIITRPDGSKVAWIDGQPQPQEVREKSKINTNAILVKVDKNTEIQLKAGQVYQREDNSVQEVFNLESETTAAENAKDSEGYAPSSAKTSGNADQSVEEPHEITKTLIDIVNRKQAAKRLMESGVSP